LIAIEDIEKVKYVKVVGGAGATMLHLTASAPD